MPLVWKIDPAYRVLVAVADGDVTRLEMERYLDAIVESAALAYRKVFDVHLGDTSMTADDVLPLAVRMRGLHELGPMGPLAVVLPTGRGKRLERALGMLAAANRAMQVFENTTLACRWLAKQDIPGTPDTVAARELAARSRYLAKIAGDEAARLHRATPPDDVLYRGQGELTLRGAPVNICVKKAGPAWDFLCCDADRRALGTLMTVQAHEIDAAQPRGRKLLDGTLDRIKSLVKSGLLAIPDTPTGAY